MDVEKGFDDCEVNEPTTSGNDNVNPNQSNLGTTQPFTSPKSDRDNIAWNIPNVISIYRQDVVRSSNSGKIGMVIEVSGDSDSDSDSSLTDDEDEGEEEDDDNDGDECFANEEGGADDDGDANRNSKKSILPTDQIRVHWVNEGETTENVLDVTVVDRGFLQGDYVTAVANPTGQVGIVVDVNISVDLLDADGSVIQNVSSTDIKRVRDFTVGDYVVLGPWLGRVDDVLDNVKVLFDDGSICKVMKVDSLHLKPVGKNIVEDGHFPYYPGQRVRASSSSVFKNARWISGLWKANRLEGTITKVTVGSLFIYWIASAGYGPDSSTTPAEEQSPKNLKLLSCFAHANWQLGDWCHLSLVPKSSSILPLAKDEVQSSPMDTSEEPNRHSEATDIEIDVENIGNNDTTRSSSLSVSKEPAHETWPLHRKRIHKVAVRRDKKAARKREENFEKAVLIVNTLTRVDVAWQDGTIERGVDSISLIPIDNPGDHEFVAQEYVVEKAADVGDATVEHRRVGVVKSVNAKERTACVRWLKPVVRAEDLREFDKEEVVSVYELEGHPDYDYCYGDVVVRLPPVCVPAQAETLENCAEELKQLTGANEVQGETTKESECKKMEGTNFDEASTDFSDLSWVGNITGLKDGDIEVTWADGMISTVGPQAIYVVGRDDDGSIADGSEVSDDAASWETVADDEMDALERSKQDLVVHGLPSGTATNTETEDTSMVPENSGKNGALAIPLAALGYVTRLASGIFSRGRKQLDPSNVESGRENERHSQIMIVERDFDDESTPQKSNIIDNYDVAIDSEKQVEDAAMDNAEMLDAAEALCTLNSGALNGPAQCNDDTSYFKGFDIAKDPHDHYFFGANGQNDNGRKWLKKVHQDWSILQNNLPAGIYVRAYEDRMDLLRAVIVGAYGTPYQDGLFFFDFRLPLEYPYVPPLAYYHSGGWRINPNLYEEGKVCLSLLNTWTGKGNEVWDASSSSILQVLVSLQGLVLNSKPYFNEAGYDKQLGTAEGEKNSLSYNENTFLLNCKTMMYLMRKPPKDFEEFVREHFRRRGYYILKACDAYMKGYLIGSLTEDASISDKSNSNSNSVGFKLMLAKIVPKLYSSLNEVGANCQEFNHLEHS